MPIIGEFCQFFNLLIAKRKTFLPPAPDFGCERASQDTVDKVLKSVYFGDVKGLRVRQENPFSRRLALALATGGGVGYLPGMPGTWGSLLVGLPLWWLLSRLGPWGYGLAWLVLLGVGLWAADRAWQLLGEADHPAIVIDEVAGLLAALAWAPARWPWVAGAFIAFRALDILKPFPLKHLERLPGGLGVVLDDVAAGVLARLLLALAMALGGNGRY